MMVLVGPSPCRSLGADRALRSVSAGLDRGGRVHGTGEVDASLADRYREIYEPNHWTEVWDPFAYAVGAAMASWVG